MKGGFLKKPAEVVNAENALEKAKILMADGQKQLEKQDFLGALSTFEAALVQYRKSGDKQAILVCLEQVGMTAAKMPSLDLAFKKRSAEALKETVQLLDEFGLGGHLEVFPDFPFFFFFFFFFLFLSCARLLAC
jgi:hypothetical protein